MAGPHIRFGSSFDDKVSGPLDKVKAKFQAVQKQGAKGFAIGAGAAITTKALSVVQSALSGVGDAILGAVDDASDLAETMAKSGVIFGTSADEISAWGDKAASSMGLSKDSAVGAAATFGSLFNNIGLAGDQSREMSKNVVALSSDLASFNNLGTEDVLEKIRAGLAGEAEPLRSLGVFINEATVKAKAMELGLGGVGRALTDGEKVQARYALILEQTTAAQGDFARTADGMANKQKIASAKMDDLSAKIGTALLPLFSALVDIGTGVIDFFFQMDSTMNGWVKTIHSAFKPLADLNDAIGSIPGPWHAAATETETAVARIAVSADEAAAAGQRIVAGLRSAFETSGIPEAAEDVTTAIAEKLESGEAVIKDGAIVLVNPLEDEMGNARDAAVAIAAKTPSEIADALRNARQEWQSAVDQLGSDLENEMTRAAEIAKLKGELAGDNIARGLKSKDPIVRQRAEATKALIVQRLGQLETEAYIEGAAGGKGFGGGLISVKGFVKTAASQVAGMAKNPLTGLPGYTWGYNTGAEYAAGLEATYGLVNSAANYVARGAVGPLKASSPPGPESPLHNIGLWAERTIGYYADRMASSASRVTQAAATAVSGASDVFGQRMTANVGLRASTVAVGAPTAVAAAAAGGAAALPPLTVVFNSLTPPSPADARRVAEAIGPEFVRWMRRQRL